MKTIKVTHLPEIIRKQDRDIVLMHVYDNQLDIDMPDYWLRDTEREYNQVTNKLDKISSKGKGYFIYVWYDISGYDYWVVNMKEDNFAQISILFDSDEIKASQIPALINKINKVIDKVQRTINY